MGVIQVEELRDLDWLRKRFVEEGVWIRPFGDAIYVTPALVMSPEELQQLCTAMVSVVQEWAER